MTAWVLFGTPPAFSRARVELPHYSNANIPGYIEVDGQAIPSRQSVSGMAVRVTFLTPDVRNEDLRILRDEGHRNWRLWSGNQQEEDFRFTWADKALLVAWRKAGGPTGRRGEDFWEDVRTEWYALSSEDPRSPKPPASVKLCDGTSTA